MDAPHNAAEAAEQCTALSKLLEDRRDDAETFARLRDRFAAMYHEHQSYATLHDEVINLGSEDRRKAKVRTWPLPADAKQEGGRLCTAMGLEGVVPSTVGDLEWLRDRASSMADSWSAKAYDAKAELSSWQTVASMVKSEMELSGTPRLRAVGE